MGSAIPRTFALFISIYGLGCIGDTPVQQQQDASVDSASTIDSPIDVGGGGDAAPDSSSGACDIAKDFGVPALVGGVNTADAEGGAHLSPDELTIYFHSNRTGGKGDYDIYTASRATTSDSFSNVLPVANINTAYTEWFPRVTTDGLALFYEARVGSTSAVVSDLWIATRGSKLVPFTNAQSILNVNSGTRDGQPFTYDGLSLFFMSQNPDNYKKIWHTTSSNGTFAAPTVVAELNAAPDDAQSPVVSADERQIFWASTRPSPSNAGSQDIFMAVRSSSSAAFGSITNVTAVNSTASDQPDWISADGCRLYLESGRSGNTEIYVATRPK